MPYDKQQIQALSQSILVRCAQELGGVAELAKHLGVPEDTLVGWLKGDRVPPVEMIMKAAGPLAGGTRPAASEPGQPRASEE